MLRQQTKPTCRIHCIIVDGGKIPNIIPERSELIICVRGIVKEDAFDLLDKVKQCGTGAAAATGWLNLFDSSLQLFLGPITYFT